MRADSDGESKFDLTPVGCRPTNAADVFGKPTPCSKTQVPVCAEHVQSKYNCQVTHPIQDENACMNEDVPTQSGMEDEGVGSNSTRSFVTKHFSFLTWNVNGLISKLKDHDFVSYVSTFDFICLVETFMEKKCDENVFPCHKLYPKPAVRFTKVGRSAGGVICLVRKELLPFVKQIDVVCANIAVFLINKKLFGTPKDVLYVCAYVHPQGSPFYVHFDIDNGVDSLEDCLIDCLLKYDAYVILCGDLNSRTSNLAHSGLNNVDFDMEQKSQTLHGARRSQDCILNSYGKLLLNMCTSLSLSILNGLCQGDLEGCYTYICDKGSSVDDYFLFSDELFDLVCDECELTVVDRIESDHMPVTVSVNLFHSVANDPEKRDICQSLEKFVWNSENIDAFVKSLNNETFLTRIDIATCIIDTDINLALGIFNEGLKECAECMRKTVFFNKNKRSDNWFDHECVMKRKHVRTLLRRYRRNLCPNVRHEFVVSRREYKKFLKQKEKCYNDMLLNKLLSSIRNQKEFWDTLNKASFKKKQPKNSIDIDVWFQHFRSLLDKEDCSNCYIDGEHDDLTNNYMNRPISAEEIEFAFRKLKNGKAPGPDSIIGEIFKYSKDQITPFMIKLFNHLFETGTFPEEWTESFILPVYKKGDINNPNNYRGISLSNICGKLFSIVINRRLQEWVEENDITGGHQAGFKKGHSTVDHMFTLLALVQKQFSLNRKLYVAFIDFEKAFDSINRNLLWPVLLKNGIKGKLYKCIRSMYEHVKCRVRSGALLTDQINCTAGVKQGDVCSPILFSLFINELALDVINNGRHGARFCNYDAYELFILLLADDVVLLSETVVGLQIQLNSLQRAATSLQLKVNMSKSDIIVFRKGGYLSAREKWTLNGISMPVVNVYKYLGILFTTRLSFVPNCKDLASRGKNALLHIMRKLCLLNNTSFQLYIKIFDAQVQPIVQYGAELWGLSKAAVHCESLHLFALKRFLCVGIRTPNDLVYGETGRYPIYVNSAVQCMRYWLKLLQMEMSRIPKKAYDMLLNLDMKGKKNWVTDIRICLFENGFGEVWLNQGVGNIYRFIKVFRQRLIDCNWQKWNDHIQNSDRFSMYRSFSHTHDIKPYLTINMDRYLLCATSRFRLGVSGLATHLYRYRQINDNDMLCPLCGLDKDDEFHFVLCCPLLDEIREIFIPAKYYQQPCLFKFCLMMSSTRENDVRGLSLFLNKAFRYRSVALS